MVAHATGVLYLKVFPLSVNSHIGFDKSFEVTLVTRKPNSLVNYSFVFLHRLLTSFELTHCALICQSHMNRSFVCIQGADAGIFFVTYVTLKGNTLMSEFNVFCESSLVLCFIIAGLAINCSVIMFSCEVKIQIILTRCFISTTDAWVENPMMHILLVSFQIGAGLGFQVALVTCI